MEQELLLNRMGARMSYGALNGIPRTPEQLFAEIQIGGEIRLSWNRNGNPQDTVFVIEFLIGNSSKWAELDKVTRPSFLYEGHRFGIPIKFRVLALKDDKTSLPSNVIEVTYGYTNNY